MDWGDMRQKNVYLMCESKKKITILSPLYQRYTNVGVSVYVAHYSFTLSSFLFLEAALFCFAMLWFPFFICIHLCVGVFGWMWSKCRHFIETGSLHQNRTTASWCVSASCTELCMSSPKVHGINRQDGLQLLQLCSNIYYI